MPKDAVTEPKPLDALELIQADLRTAQRRKRTHFVPAVVLIGIVVIGSFVIAGTRPDPLDQPPAQLALQLALWALCLFAFPAIGVGLWFPGRGARLGLTLVAVLLTLAVTTGWPLAGTSLLSHGMGASGCLTLTLGTGIALLGIGFLSGAFIQRHRVSAVFWVGAGLSLMALNVITWHCPNSGLLHVLPMHLGGAALLLAVAIGVGIFARSRDKRCA